MYSNDNQSNSSLKLELINKERTYKNEKPIYFSKNIENVINGKPILNFYSNNYLGLDNISPDNSLSKPNTKKYGASSVLFRDEIQSLKKQIEIGISNYLKKESTFLFSTFQDVYGGVFDSLFTDKDMIFYDEQNHFTLTDTFKSGKIASYQYKNNDLNDLEQQLRKTKLVNYRYIYLVTDGVFSMDGTIADLQGICELAQKYGAIVLLNDSHGTGVLGSTGRGSHEHHKIEDRVDLIISTFGNISGMPLGNFLSGNKEFINLIKERSNFQGYLNSLSSTVIKTQNKILKILNQEQSLTVKLSNNINYFRKNIKEAGFDTFDSVSSIIPVMMYDARLAQHFADKLFHKGIWVTSFFYPVVPVGKARVRVLLSSAHSCEDMDKAINAFVGTGKELGII